MIAKVGLNVASIDGDKNKIEKTENVKENNPLSYKEATNKESNEIIKKDIKPLVTKYRALWVIDEKNNVLIRIEDEEGNLIRQIPPDEIIRLREKINQFIKKNINVE